jgi:hypothetical protein
VTLERTVVARNLDLGILGYEPGTLVELTDALVGYTEPRVLDRSFGRGISVQAGATVRVARTVVERSRDLGLAAFDPGTELTATDLVIRDTRERECESCPGLPVGLGVSVIDPARVTISRFAISEAATCGVFLSHDAELDLSGGIVSRSPLGACVQVDGYDLARLTDDVRYEDNGANLEATTLPVPSSAPPLP